MKRFTYILLLLAISTLAIAQEFTVKRFEATNDLTARDSRYLRNDLNGNPCALVKVQVALTGVEFEGNKIGDVQYKTSEYWVYLPTGDKRLKIKHPNYLPLTVMFADYGIERLEGKTTYVLVLNAPVAVSATQSLTVKYSPSNATLLIDGKLVKGSKGIATLDLPVGSHSYNAVLDGYVEQMGTVTLSASSPGKLVIELDKESAVASNNVNVDQSTQQQPVTQVTQPVQQTQTVSALNSALNLDEQYDKAVKFDNNKDYTQALPIFKMLAEKGHAKAQNYLGYYYYKGESVSQDYSKAVEWYTKSANQGYAVAQFNLGFCYKNGQGVSQDYTKAVEWYTKSANQGNAIAQNNLGICYENGEGVNKDLQKAIELYTKSANQGNARAQNSLGICYYNGEGVNKDLQKAIELYTKAANQGYAAAQNNLGICYENGEGVNKDLQKAIELYKKAAAQGNNEAKTNLERLGVSLALSVPDTKPSSSNTTITVHGEVVDRKGALIGAAVVVDGTTKGVVTDIDGKFTLDVKEGTELVISYIGYKRVKVKALDKMRVVMHKD